MKHAKKIIGAALMLVLLAGSAFASGHKVQLVLLRHGESEWNLEKRFTGWSDIRLTREGVKQAFDAGFTMKEAGLEFDTVHVSLLNRAIATAWLAVSALDSRWIPIEKYWRLNERCYGDLEGKTQQEVTDAVGKEQVNIWRRSFDVPPPPLPFDDPRSPANDPRYVSIDRRVLPQSESLKDVIARLQPYWADSLLPQIHAGYRVLVVGHSTALRALSAWIDSSLSQEDLMKLEISNATPIVYTLELVPGGVTVVSRETLKVIEHPMAQETEKKEKAPAEKTEKAAS